jgi:hypothetical protein
MVSAENALRALQHESFVVQKLVCLQQVQLVVVALDAVESKLEKSVVLYFDAAEIGNKPGAVCNKCAMYFGDLNGMGGCTVLTGKISGPTGVCGLYVNGKPQQDAKPGKLDKSTAGYGLVGPTHCGSCKFFNPEGSCKVVAGEIEFGGCCNQWEKETNRDWRI